MSEIESKKTNEQWASDIWITLRLVGVDINQVSITPAIEALVGAVFLVRQELIEAHEKEVDALFKKVAYARKQALEECAEMFEDESCIDHEATGVCVAARVRALSEKK